MTAVATRTVEVLHFGAESTRAKTWLDTVAGVRADDFACQTTETYRGESDLLVLWGPGAPNRFEPMRRQIASGGHVLALDLAYWQRDVKARISIDAPHPQAWVMKKSLPSTRFLADKVPVADRWNPSGPILVAGIGEKARTQYGVVVEHWEAQMVAACHAYGRPIWYRPKKAHDTRRPTGTIPAPASSQIDAVLSGCSLVVTWHSNVAVDAIRMGIPVVCKDGAAAAVCPSVPSLDQRPLPAEWRDRFLANLAWFQWAPNEAAQMWRFVFEMLP